MHFVVEAQSSPRWLFSGRCAHCLEEAGIRAGIGAGMVAAGRAAQLHRGTGHIPLPAEWRMDFAEYLGERWFEMLWDPTAAWVLVRHPSPIGNRPFLNLG